MTMQFRLVDFVKKFNLIPNLSALECFNREQSTKMNRQENFEIILLDLASG